MKGILATLLLLCLIQSNFWSHVRGQWRRPFIPPGQSFQSPGHSFQPPGHSFQPPGHSFSPPGPPPFQEPGFGHSRYDPPTFNWYPQAQQQSNGIDISTAEWVCQNQKTGDMMIIAEDRASNNRLPGQNGGWPNQHGSPNTNGNPNNANFNNGIPNNVNSNHGNPDNVNSNKGNPGRVDFNNMNLGTTPPTTTNPIPKTDVNESANLHGGEGLIDVRIGDD